MVEFLKIQYRLGKVTEEQLNKLILEGKITEDNKEYIMS